MVMQPFEAGAAPRIVHEDECLLAVYKPARLHCAPLGGGGDDLASWLFSQRPRAAFDAGALRGKPGEGGLFHRLDFETSGLVLFALDPASLASLLRSQEAGLMVKGYRALARPSAAMLAGSSPSRGVPAGIDAADWEAALAGSCPAARGGAEGLARIASMASGRHIEGRFRPYGPGGARVACLGPGEVVQGGGRRRHGSPEAAYSTEIGTICATEWPGAGPVLDAGLRIRRGFRHQIRAHMAWMGLPLLGDRLYGGMDWPRLCLHAHSLSFPHPRDGAAFTIGIP
jgi:23S rRNA pseudouridine1911/1915/1917 synthase